MGIEVICECALPFVMAKLIDASGVDWQELILYGGILVLLATAALVAGVLPGKFSARAAVADTPLPILDEATSSIDTRMEKLVQQGTDRLMKGRTVFVIAHRLSTVQSSGDIIVLDHGQIIEEGAHARLMAAKGRYYSLYTGAFELE